MRSITPAEYRAIIRRGIDPRTAELTPFGHHLYDNASVLDMLECLRLQASRADCEEFGVTPKEWRGSIYDTLALLAYLFESEHHFTEPKQ